MTTKLKTLTITEISVVDAPANELDGWMVTKALGRATTLDAIKAIIFKPRGLTDISDETLAKAVEQYGYAVPLIASGDVEVVKGRHSTRAPQGTYQAAEPVTNIGGVPFRHSGAVHATIRRLAAQRGKGAPTDSGEKGITAYDGEGGDPMGNQHPASSPAY